MRVDALFFGVHPDDVELCCGGMVAQMVQEGLGVGVCDLTRGEAGTRADATVREREAKEAAKILGIKQRVSLDLGDARLFDDEERRKEVCKLIRTLRPKMIVLPSPEQRHPDHKVAYDLIKGALFLARLKKIELSLPPFTPSIVLEYPMEWFTNPTFVIDITKTFSKKLEALNAYASQLQQDYIRRIEARDRLYGSFIQVEYGEPLCNSTPLKIPSLSTFLWR